METSVEYRKQCAKKSKIYECARCGLVSNLLPNMSDTDMKHITMKYSKEIGGMHVVAANDKATIKEDENIELKKGSEQQERMDDNDATEVTQDAIVPSPKKKSEGNQTTNSNRTTPSISVTGSPTRNSTNVNSAVTVDNASTAQQKKDSSLLTSIIAMLVVLIIALLYRKLARSMGLPYV